MQQLSIREQLYLKRKTSMITGFIAVFLGIVATLAGIWGYSVMFGSPWFNYVLGIFFFFLGYLLLGGLSLIRR